MKKIPFEIYIIVNPFSFLTVPPRHSRYTTTMTMWQDFISRKRTGMVINFIRKCWCVPKRIAEWDTRNRFGLVLTMMTMVFRDRERVLNPRRCWIIGGVFYTSIADRNHFYYILLLLRMGRPDADIHVGGQKKNPVHETHIPSDSKQLLVYLWRTISEIRLIFRFESILELLICCGSLICLSNWAKRLGTYIKCVTGESWNSVDFHQMWFKLGTDK